MRISFIESLINSLYQKGGNDQKILNLENFIYPMELLGDENYKKFGLKEIFAFLYEQYKNLQIQRSTTGNRKFVSQITTEMMNHLKNFQPVNL